MLKSVMFIWMLAAFTVSGMDCSKFCVLKVEMDTVPGYMLVTLFHNDSGHVNYPTVQVVNAQGDTIGNPAGTFNLFAHMASDTIVYQIPATVSTLPVNFYGTVLVTDQVWDTTCVLNYPMPCSQHVVYPDCNFLEVTAIAHDSGANLATVTLFNHCTFCASGFSGPVYCEMTLVRKTAPFDTLASSNCYCLLTPANNNWLNYTINAYVNEFPPPQDMLVLFNCGSGICDSLNHTITSLPEVQEDPDITLYPNPTLAGGDILINSQEAVTGVQLMGLDGRMIRQETRSRILKTSGLSAGVYFVLVSTGTQTRSFKLVLR